ncbi:hypothetical protein TrST_g9768 [Triparma strigata]|uniref:Fatty acid hydroxylase domain-containing protein n=1 Tax=Triparma strigata TaxID=1606541 RepID=A0A9W6ZSB0_9STRA|nr:hypothetical protein TrST_g9768 [Triparma strigata]
MLCEFAPSSFVATWALLTAIGFSIVMISSSIVFFQYYWTSNVTYEKWKWKTNPKFPSPEKVRDEIVQTAKGIYTATIPPTISIYLAQTGNSKAYCSGNPLTDADHGGAIGVLVQFLLITLVSDFWEWGYHRLGHVYPRFWNFHKHHHVFFNPSPFAVIADEYVDQFFRALPLLLFPMIVPINMDVMFFTYGAFFYMYGIYLHWGYETPWLSAHNPIFNSAYHHYLHHAKAILGKPYHTGFFFKIWDNMVEGGVYPRDKCFCVQCEQKKGKRSPEMFKKVVVPDYSVLLDWRFWTGDGAWSGISASDENAELTAEEKVFASAAKRDTVKKVK